MLNEVAKAQHTKRYVSISTSEAQCKIYPSEPFHLHTSKIVNDGGNFVLSEVAKAQHTKRYVSISTSEVQCKIYPSERF